MSLIGTLGEIPLADVDTKLEQEWRRSVRFAEGVLRVEVRAGRD